MLKRLSTILSIVMVWSVMLLQGAPLNETQEVDGYSVVLSSEKPLTMGSNELRATVSKDGKALNNLQVLQIKLFMPAMPGMPYMESKSEGELAGDAYRLKVNLSMGGTWQYQLRFKDSDGNKHQIKGSVNF